MMEKQGTTLPDDKTELYHETHFSCPFPPKILLGDYPFFAEFNRKLISAIISLLIFPIFC